MKKKRKQTLGFIKDNILYFNDDNTNKNIVVDNDNNQSEIDKENAIDIENVDDNFSYEQNQVQNNYVEQPIEQQEEEFDYTLLKVIIFLIFV